MATRTHISNSTENSGITHLSMNDMYEQDWFNLHM